MTVINVYRVHAGSSIFKDCQNVVNVDCNGIAWANNSTCNAFYNCVSLKSVTNLPNNLVNMANTYRNCQSLVNYPRIEGQVEDLRGTFAGCKALSSPPTIPSSVKYMDNCFEGCTNLVSSPRIPDNVVSVTNIFTNCSRLAAISDIPEGLDSLQSAFVNCTNLTTAPTIPGSVEDLSYTFYNCTKLTQAPTLSAAVTNTSHLFYGCTNIKDDIYVYSSNVTNAQNMFGATTEEKTLYLPFRYANHRATATYNALIAAGYSDEVRVHGILLQSMDLVTFTINPTPASAKVTLVGEGSIQTGNSITVKKNTDIRWTVELYGYVTQSGTVNLDSNETRNIELARENYTYTIIATPEDAVITLTADGYEQDDNSITVPYETEVQWEVSSPHYVTQSGTKVITVTETEEKDLVLENYTFTIIPIPLDSTVQISAEGYARIGNSITVPYGTKITWSVTKDNYIAQSGVIPLYKNTDLNVKLIEEFPEGKTIFESSEPGNYNVILPYTMKYGVVIVGPGGDPGHRIKSDRYFWALGGSGSMCSCNQILEAGTYPVQIGRGGSEIDSTGFDCISGAGKHGYFDGIEAIQGEGGIAIPATGFIGTNGRSGDISGVYKDRHGAGGYGIEKRAYNGENGYIRVFETEYEPGTVIFESDIPGTYNVVLQYSQSYEITIIGGGGGGAHDDYWVFTAKYNGGSGAKCHGIVNLEKGTYQAVVGAGGTSKYWSSTASVMEITADPGIASTFLGNVAGGGNGGRAGASYYGGAWGNHGTGGIAQPIEGFTGQNGSAGDITGIDGHGAGGQDDTTNGGSGYIKIVAL